VRPLLETLEMNGQPKGAPALNSKEFVDTISELKAPILDRDTGLGERHEDVVDERDLRHT
jgi:hypothetical protein